MVLAIDIGNTNIVIGGFESGKVLFTERLSTNKNCTVMEYTVLIKSVLELCNIEIARLDGGIISSVVPSVTSRVKEAIEKITGAKVFVLGPGLKTGVKIAIDNPAQAGADLVAGAAAAVAEYPCPIIVIDMGTATTITVIDKSERFIGGMIMPGLRISLESLTSSTSQLPNISLDPPKRVIGSNTVDCMKSGLIYGNAAAIDGTIERIEAELGESCTVVATGGLAGVITPLCKRDIIVDDKLLLKGLMEIYNKNK